MDRTSARRSLFGDTYMQLDSTIRQVDLALVAELEHNMRGVCVNLAISAFDERIQLNSLGWLTE